MRFISTDGAGRDLKALIFRLAGIDLRLHYPLLIAECQSGIKPRIRKISTLWSGVKPFSFQRIQGTCGSRYDGAPSKLVRKDIISTGCTKANEREELFTQI
jgi:hypothetical protein